MMCCTWFFGLKAICWLIHVSDIPEYGVLIQLAEIKLLIQILFRFYANSNTQEQCRTLIEKKQFTIVCKSLNLIWILFGSLKEDIASRYNLSVAVYFVIVYYELGDLFDLNTLIIFELLFPWTLMGMLPKYLDRFMRINWNTQKLLNFHSTDTEIVKCLQLFLNI
jgi:uncharacterized membrane protein